MVLLAWKKTVSRQGSRQNVPISSTVGFRFELLMQGSLAVLTSLLYDTLTHIRIRISSNSNLFFEVIHSQGNRNPTPSLQVSYVRLVNHFLFSGVKKGISPFSHPIINTLVKKKKRIPTQIFSYIRDRKSRKLRTATDE